jgi:hypothetical protein
LTKEEFCTRIKVAYEQLGKVHTAMCKDDQHRYDTGLIYDVQDILNSILRLQVKLGLLKKEEDIK